PARSQSGATPERWLLQTPRDRTFKRECDRFFNLRNKDGNLMTVGELTEILNKCPCDAEVNFDHADPGTFRISPVTHVELNRISNSVFLYEDLPTFDRFAGECIELTSMIQKAPNFVETTYRESFDDYVGEAILDRFIDPEELNIDR
ncbi:hypothetical protein, partial [Microcoleus anatoxicus]|uniref:hypothetical protein n=1 Tax=Microcoleus anatoxicus TaxID=2705319 RepID=UPI0030C94E6B